MSSSGSVIFPRLPNINPSTYGQQIHLVAKVTPEAGPVPTAGTVSWFDNGTLLGTARVTGIGTSRVFKQTVKPSAKEGSPASSSDDQALVRIGTLEASQLMGG